MILLMERLPQETGAADNEMGGDNDHHNHRHHQHADEAYDEIYAGNDDVTDAGFHDDHAVNMTTMITKLVMLITMTTMMWLTLRVILIMLAMTIAKTMLLKTRMVAMHMMMMVNTTVARTARA